MRDICNWAEGGTPSGQPVVGRWSFALGRWPEDHDDNFVFLRVNVAADRGWPKTKDQRPTTVEGGLHYFGCGGPSWPSGSGGGGPTGVRLAGAGDVVSGSSPGRRKVGAFAGRT